MVGLRSSWSGLIGALLVLSFVGQVHASDEVVLGNQLKDPENEQFTVNFNPPGSDPWCHGFEWTVNQTAPVPAIIQPPLRIHTTGPCVTSADNLQVTFPVENGHTAELTIYSLNSLGERIAAKSRSYVMDSRAPRLITQWNSSSSDGRHITFNLTVPADRGELIQQLVFRRNNPAAPKPESFLHDYVVDCNTPSILCDDVSYVQTSSTTPATATDAHSICYDSMSCMPGETVAITLGAHLFPENSFYIHPTVNYAWQVIALNSHNLNCRSSGTCDDNEDLSLRTTGWSTTWDGYQREQGAASPDRVNATNYHLASDITQTSAVISWAAPVDNGAVVDTYRATCRDTSLYLGQDVAGDTDSWRQSVAMEHLHPSITTINMTALYPGTTYTCAVGSNNSAGGFEDVLDTTWHSLATDRSLPDPIVDSTISCTPEYDFLWDGNGKAPDGGTQFDVTGYPTTRLIITWRAPRPNDARLNANGPDIYHLQGTLGDANFTNSSTLAAFQFQETAADVRYMEAIAPALQYDPLHDATKSVLAHPIYMFNKNYNFQLMPFNLALPQPTDVWGAPQVTPASVSCSLGGFRPLGPVVSLMRVTSRSVAINWTKPITNGRDEFMNTHTLIYHIQICEGATCYTTVKDFEGRPPSEWDASDDPQPSESWRNRMWACNNGVFLSKGEDIGACGAPGPEASCGDCQDHGGAAQAGAFFSIDKYYRTAYRANGTPKNPKWGEPHTLKPNTTYSLVVRANNAKENPTSSDKLPNRPQDNIYGAGYPSTRLVFTTKAVPQPPAIGSLTARSVTLNWAEYTEVAGETPESYNITVIAPDRFGVEHIHSKVVTGLTTTFDGLTPSQTGRAYVQATVAGETTDQSDPTPFDTLPDVPDAPVMAPTLSQEATTSVNASWGEAYYNGLEVTSYTVHLATSDPYAVNLTVVVSAPNMSAVVVGLVPQANYTLSVAAENANGLGPFSPEVPHSPCSQVPAGAEPPTKIPGNSSTTSLGITWGAPRVHGAEYDHGVAITDWRVKFKYLVNGVESEAQEVGSDRNSIEIKGLESGRPYAFAVSAKNGVPRTRFPEPFGTPCGVSVTEDVGWGPYGEWSATMFPDAVPPEAPSVVRAQFGGADGQFLNVEWDANFDSGANITAYTVYSNATAGGAPLVFTRDNDEVIISNGGVVLLPLWSLPTTVRSSAFRCGGNCVPNSPYWFQVTANNSAGESPRSNVSVLWTDFFVPDRLPLSNFQPELRGTQSDAITVAWTPPRDNGLEIFAYELSMLCTAESDAVCPAGAMSHLGGHVVASEICSPASEGGPCTILQFQVPSLGEGLGYQFSVRSNNGYGTAGSPHGQSSGQNGWSDPSEWITIFVPSAESPRPPPPEAVNILEVLSTSVLLNWRVIPQIEFLRRTTPSINRFRLTYAIAQDGATPVVETINSGFEPGKYFNHTLSDLRPDTTYSFRYEAGNIAGLGPETNATFRTASDAPGAPGTPTIGAEGFSNTTIWLSFATPPANGYAIDNYTIELYEHANTSTWAGTPPVAALASATMTNGHLSTVDDGTTVTTAIGEAHGGDAHVLDGILSPGTSYLVRVKATNSLGDSAWSSLAAVQTSDAPEAPAVPQKGSPISGLDTRRAIMVVWTPPNDHGSAISAYQIAVDGGEPKAIPGTPFDGFATYIMGPDVVPGSTHNFTVQAYNQYGWSSWSPVAFLTADPDKPSMNGKPTFTPANHVGVGATFDVIIPPALANGMNLTTLTYELRDNEGRYHKLGLLTTWSNATYTTFSGCGNDFIAKSFQARATNALGDSEWTEAARPSVEYCNGGVTFPPSAPPAIPRSPSAPPMSPPATPPAPPDAPPPFYLPAAPENLRAGEGVPGLSDTTFVHLVWSPPTGAEGLVLPINRYALMTSMVDPANGQLVTTAQNLSVPGFVPSQGVIVASVNGVALSAGSNVSFTVQACNDCTEASCPHGGDGGYAPAGINCGPPATTHLSTNIGAPGKPKHFKKCPEFGAAADCYGHNTNATHLVVALGAANDGGRPISKYEVSMSTLPSGADENGRVVEVTFEPPGVFVYPRNTDLSYFLTAKATNSEGAGAISEMALVLAVSGDGPPAPVNLAVSTIGPRFFTIDFEMPEAFLNVTDDPAEIKRYRINFACDTDAATCPAGVPMNVEFAMPRKLDGTPDCPFASGSIVMRRCSVIVHDSSIQPKSYYAITLQSLNIQASEASTSIKLPTGSGPPEAPGLSATPVTEYTTSGFTVSFLAAEANGEALLPYKLTLDYSREDDPSGSLTTLNAATVDSTTLSHTFEGLPAGANCTITVTAENTLGNSTPTVLPGHYFTLHAPRIGSAPTMTLQPLQGLPTTNNLHIAWTPPFDFCAPISGYTLIVDGVNKSLDVTPSASTAGACGASVGTEFVHTGLDPGTRHTFRVAATNAIGQGPFSTEVEFYTEDAVPAAPPKPTVVKDHEYGAPSGQREQMNLTLHVTAVPGTSDAASLIYNLHEYRDGVAEPTLDINISVGETLTALPSPGDDFAPRKNATWPSLVRMRNPEIKYSYKVRAINHLGYGPFSDDAEVARDAVVLTRATNVRATDALTPTVTWSIEAGVGSALRDGAHKMEVQLLTDNGGVHCNARALVARSQVELTVDSSCTCGSGTTAATCECQFTLGVDATEDEVNACSEQFDGIRPNNDYTVAVRTKVPTTSFFVDSEATAIRTPEAAPDPPQHFHIKEASTAALTYAWQHPPSNSGSNRTGPYDLKGYVLVLSGTSQLGAPTCREYALSASGACPAGVPCWTSCARRRLAASVCDALSSSAAVPVTPSHEASFEVSDLPPGTAFTSQLYACAETWGASDAACLCFGASCAGGCGFGSRTDGSVLLAPVTHGKPPRPAERVSSEGSDDSSLDELRITTLFPRWEAPPLVNGLLHGYEHTATQIEINGEKTNLSAAATSVNITERRPATQYRVRVRWQNACQFPDCWGAWSDAGWLTTLPTKPETPPPPVCGEASPDGQTLTTTSQLVVFLKEPTSTNGQPITTYDVELELLGQVVYAQELLTASNPSRVLALTLLDFRNLSALTPSTPLRARTRALNSIGWSEWSAQSSLCSVAEEPINWTLYLIIAGGVIVGLVFCLWCVFKSNLGKILAPRLRRKHSHEVITDFVSNDMTPMEEQDPELVLNPIFVHKMKRERERQRRQKLKNPNATGKSGGLARLGINLTPVEEKQDPKKLDMQGVDRYLERDKGVLDAAKELSETERAARAKQLTKGAKKAMTSSNLKQELAKKEHLGKARDDARRAATEAIPVKVAEEEDPIERSYMKPGGGKSGRYTAQL